MVKKARLIALILLTAHIWTGNAAEVGSSGTDDLDSTTEIEKTPATLDSATSEKNDDGGLDGTGLNRKIVTIEIFPPKIGLRPGSRVESTEAENEEENSVTVDIPNPFDGSVAGVSDFENSEKKDTEPTGIEIDDAVVGKFF